LVIRWLLALIVASSGSVAASEPCRPIDGIEPLLGPGKVVLLGEIHGTGRPTISPAARVSSAAALRQVIRTDDASGPPGRELNRFG
jgi:hypothetical protein